MGLKHSINSPFLNKDFPDLSTAHTFDLINDLILKDSCPLKISTSKLPLLVEFNFDLRNLVNFFFFSKYAVKKSMETNNNMHIMGRKNVKANIGSCQKRN